MKKRFFCILTKGRKAIPDIHQTMTDKASVVDEDHLIPWIRELCENYLHLNMPQESYQKYYDFITCKGSTQKYHNNIYLNIPPYRICMSFFFLPGRMFRFYHAPNISIGWVEDQNGMRKVMLFPDYMSSVKWSLAFTGKLEKDGFNMIYYLSRTDRMMLSYQNVEDPKCVMHVCHQAFEVNGFPDYESKSFKPLPLN